MVYICTFLICIFIASVRTLKDFFFFFFLRVLTLWFDYGHWADVNEALVEGIKTIQIDTWLQVRRIFIDIKSVIKAFCYS